MKLNSELLIEYIFKMVIHQNTKRKKINLTKIFYYINI